jgi:hypothetical protein
MAETEPRASNAATTTIPSSEPSSAPQEAPSSSKVPSKPRPNAGALQKSRLLLIRALYRLAYTTDATLIRLSRVLSTPAGTDSLLCTISYTLKFLRSILSKVLEHRLASIATDIAEQAEAILLPGQTAFFPGETLIATLQAPRSTKLLAQVVGSSKALENTISDFRIFVRLWGLVGIYTWGRDTWNNPLQDGAGPKEKALRSVEWAEIVASVAFQVLENGAYLSSKDVLTSAAWLSDAGKKRELWWDMWGSRFWSAQVVLEFVRLYVIWLYSEKKAEVDKVEQDGEKEDKIAHEQRQREEKRADWLWWRDLINSGAYFPMTLHWSSETGLLSDVAVGLCGMFAGGAMFVDHWTRTA